MHEKHWLKRSNVQESVVWDQWSESPFSVILIEALFKSLQLIFRPVEKASLTFWKFESFCQWQWPIHFERNHKQTLQLGAYIFSGLENESKATSGRLCKTILKMKADESSPLYAKVLSIVLLTLDHFISIYLKKPILFRSEIGSGWNLKNIIIDQWLLAFGAKTVHLDVHSYNFRRNLL